MCAAKLPAFATWGQSAVCDLFALMNDPHHYSSQLAEFAARRQSAAQGDHSALISGPHHHSSKLAAWVKFAVWVT